MTAPTCLASGAPLTNPTSRARGWCRAHDPQPELRTDRPAPRVRAPVRTQPGPDLLTELEETMHDQPEPAESTTCVLAEVADERERQNAKWGEQNHPDGTGTDAWPERIQPAFGWSGSPAEHVAKLARAHCQRMAKRNAVTWLDILLEEVAEAFAESDPGKLRTELVQVAAVATQWVEAIDRRAAMVEVTP